MKRLISEFVVTFSIVLLAGLAAHTAVSYPIVDTGQTVCYGNAGSIPAPAPGAAFYGQDAQVTGRQPSYRNNGDGTITDLNTGLMWVKARGSQVTWTNAMSGAATCTVGGYKDWRAPTIKELYSLINFTGQSSTTSATSIPYLNTAYFDFVYGAGGTAIGTRLIDCQDWSATRYVSTTMNGNPTAFGVNFADGRIKGYPISGGPSVVNYIRYVRGNTSYGVNHYTNNGDGTVTDAATGLMWAQTDSGTGMNWQDALAWVQAKNAVKYLGHSDWRMPNAKELQSIVDYTRSPATSNSPAIDPVFTSTSIINEGGVLDYPYVWASTTHLDNMGGVYVSFGRALGWMQSPGSTTYTLMDVHGAGAQRSDPKSGSVTSYYLGTSSTGAPAYGRGPQGDVIRILNYVRLVRDAGTPVSCTITPSAGANGTISPSTVQTVNANGNVTFTATPNSGYTVNAWSVDGNATQSSGTSYTLTAITASHTINVSFKPLPAAPVPAPRPGAKTPAVIVPPTPLRIQPDLAIRTTAASSYTGVGIVSLDGTGETVGLTVPAGVAAAYVVRVQNAGTTTDVFTLTGPGSSSGWVVSYFNLATSADLTAQVVNGGWKTASLAPGDTAALWVQVTPATTVKSGSTRALLLTATSSKDKTKQDAVKAVTTKQ